MKSKSRKRRTKWTGINRPNRKSRTSRDRQSSSLSLEPLEVRALLATVTPVVVGPDDLSPLVRSAFERVSDLSQYSEAELTSTTDWVANTTQGNGAAQLASTLQLSASEFRAAAYLDDTYVFSTAATSVDVISALQTSGIAEYFYPLVGELYTTKFAPNDPLFADQWHLFNSGQNGAAQGEDARVVSVWDQYTGDGVVIGVVDDGLQVDHPDLVANVRSELGFDFVDGDSDPSPVFTFESHGTQVAGVAAGVGDNSLGITGAAFGADLAGLRLLGGNFEVNNDDDIANALNFQNGAIDIYNNSWGPVDGLDWFSGPGPLTTAVLEANALGNNIYTWAAGNGLQVNDNVNFDGFANSPYTLAVTAVNDAGRQAFYAEPGAPILVAAHSDGFNQGITTADLTGGDGDNRNGMDFDPLADLDYTSQFGGTSSATPLASGVIALMLEANPTLSFRDVEQILVRTARQNDARDAGWTLNGAGHLINNKYGFGVIDAQTAVAQAEVWNRVNAEQILDFGQLDVNMDIPDFDPTVVTTGVTFTFDVPELDAGGNSILDFRIEHSILEISTDHTFGGDLEIVLTSPAGTESVLATPHNDPTSPDGWSFTSVRNWDESPVGTWTVTVRDLSAEDTGNFQNVRLSITGSQGSPLNFPVAPPTTGIVTGTVFNDANANDLQDVGEGGLAGRLVFIDNNRNGLLDDGEPIEMAGTGGDYIFTGVQPGQHQIALACSAGVATSSPAAQLITANVTAATTSFNNDIADEPAGSGCGEKVEVVVTVFDDVDGDSIRDDDEDGVAGLVAYVDLNNDCIIGLGEPQAMSNGAGTIRIGDVPPGEYVVRMAPHPGRLMELPCNGLAITVLPSGNVIGEPEFATQAASDSSGSGAQHGVVPGFHLGDMNNVDDGVFFPTGFTPGTTEELIVFANQLSVSRGYLQGWVDFNGDGDWKDAGEQIFRDQRLEDGQNTLTFHVPAGASASAAAVRFRWGFEQNLGAFGDAFGGEAEHYIVSIPSEGNTGLVAVDDSATVSGSTPVTIDVLANDRVGPLGGSLTITDFTTPTAGGGMVALVGEMLVYTPTADFVGPDSFSYTVTDTFGGTATATVTVSATFPIARDDSFEVLVNSTNEMLDVLANDLSSPTGTEGLTITGVQSPTSGGGSVSVSSDGAFLIYTPLAGFAGGDTFVYTVTDAAGGTANGTVTVTVADLMAQARIRLDVTDSSGNPVSSAMLGEDLQLRGFTTDLREMPLGVFSAYLDVIVENSDLIEISSDISFGSEYPNAQSGTVAKGLIDEVGAADGTSPLGGGEFLLFTVDFTTLAAGEVNFLADPADALPIHETTVFGVDFPLAVDLLDLVSDSLVISAIGASGDEFTVPEDSVQAPLNVLDNDVAPPGAGPLSLVPPLGPPSNGGTVTISGDQVLYTPMADFVGVETFTYTAQDTNGVTYGATVTVTVTPVNDNPIAMDDSFVVADSAVDFQLDVLANDSTGPDTGETLLIDFADTTGSAGGTITVAADGLSLLYTPPAGFLSPPDETFSYTITDNNGGTATATVSITVAADQKAAFVLNVTDLSGNPISNVATGDQFQVQVLVQDLRDAGNAMGVFSAYLDVLYSSELVTINGPIDFNDAVYPAAQKGDISNPGIVDELGAVDGVGLPDGISPTDQVLLATLTFTANAPGSATFEGDPADQLPQNETTLFGVNQAVPSEALTFLNDAVTITGTPVFTRFTNTSNPMDVNSDFQVTPLDALAVINDLNVNGSRRLATPSRGLTSGPQAMVDVNSDGYASPIDALLVINELDRVASSPQAALSSQTSDGSNLSFAHPLTGTNTANMSDRPAAVPPTVAAIDLMFEQSENKKDDQTVRDYSWIYSVFDDDAA